MKTTILTSIAASFALTGVAACVQVPTDLPAVETFALRATVTSDNHCTVEALGKTYTSIGQVRGAVPPNFIGSLENDGYHAIGCWVKNVDGSDGDLVILFSGGSLNQPFATGTFMPTFEPPFGSAEKIVSVSFHASSYVAEKLKTIVESTGAVTVESSATGARTIRVDVSAMKFQL